MFKKLIMLGVAVVMLFSVLAFAGCENAEMLRRIEALERETEELRQEQNERISELEAEIETLNEQLETLGNQLEALTGQLNELTKLLGENSEAVKTLGGVISELEKTVATLTRRIEILERELFGIIPFWLFFPGWEEYFDYIRSPSFVLEVFLSLPRPSTLLIRSRKELEQLFAEINIFLFDENWHHYHLFPYEMIRDIFDDEYFSEFVFLFHQCLGGRPRGYYYAFNATIEDEVLTLHCRFHSIPFPMSSSGSTQRVHVYTFRQDDVKNITTVQFNDN